MKNLSQHCFHYKPLTKPHSPMTAAESDMLFSDTAQLELENAKKNKH